MAGKGPAPDRRQLHDAKTCFHIFAFEPEHIQAMGEAFDAVCVKLQLSMGSEDLMTELVGETIIELARAGERNPDRLLARHFVYRPNASPARKAGREGATRGDAPFGTANLCQ